MSTSIVDAIGRVPLSANLTATLTRAAEYAGAQGHVEVTLEHLLLALTEDPDAALVLSISRVEVDALKGDISSQLGRIEERAASASLSDLRISTDLRQILEAAAAAADGRRREIDGAIVLAAIVGEGKSAAAHLLRAHGLTFETAIRALQQAAAVTQPPVTQPPRNPERPTQQPQQPAQRDPATTSAPAEPTGQPTNDSAEARDGPAAATVATTPAASAGAGRTPSHHSTSSAEDILASARQRVQGRAAPGLPELQVREPRDRQPPAEPPRAQPRPAALPGGVEGPGPQSSTGEAQRSGPATAAGPDTLAAAEAAAEAEFASMAAQAKRDHSETALDDLDFESLDAPAARPAPSTPRPSPPGAIRPAPAPQYGAPAGPAATASPGDRDVLASIRRADSDGQPPSGGQPPPGGRMPQPPQHPAAGTSHAPGQPTPPPARPPVFGQYPPAPPMPRPPVPGHGAAASAQRPAMPPIPSSRPIGSPPLPPGAAPAPRAAGAPAIPPGPFGPPPGPAANAARPPSAPPAAPSHTAPPLEPAQPRASANSSAPHPSSATVSGGRQLPSSISIGQLVENIPRSMRVAIPSIVEVRIARAEVKAVAQGMQGSSATFHHELTVTKAMSVRLRAPDGGFFIETSSPETQWIDRVHSLMSDDYASWRWTVTPKVAGRKRLQLVIAARTVGTDGLTAETQLPEQVVEVSVRTNYGMAMKRVAGWAVAAILGGVLARFGEDLPHAVASLTQMLIK